MAVGVNQRWTFPGTHTNPTYDNLSPDDGDESESVSYMDMSGGCSYYPRSSSLNEACSYYSSVRNIGYFPNIILQALSDFHYGQVSAESAESLCNEVGEFLIRNGGTSDGDLRLTVKTQTHHAHFTIYKDIHPYSANHHIYFLDDRTKQHLFASVLELMQFIVNIGYLPQSEESIKLHPCSKCNKKVLNSSDIIKGKLVNPNPVSSKTYYAGYYGSLKIVLVQKEKQSRVFAEAAIRTEFSSHPNIVGFIGVSVVNQVCLVLPEEAQHSLYRFIRQLKVTKTRQMIKACHNVCCGMIYLHSINCLHRSLQAKACIIDHTGTVKISDFDKSCFAESDIVYPSRDESVHVPTRWAAPEVLNHSEFSKSSDVWSFGVFVWEVFNCGKIPYHELKNDQLMEQLKPGFRLSLMAKKQSPYDLILDKCLRYNRNNRPSFDFLEGIIQTFLS